MPLCPAQLQRWRLAFETAARPRGNNNNRWRYCEGEVSVVKAKNQTVEDIYRLVCAAIATVEANNIEREGFAVLGVVVKAIDDAGNAAGVSGPNWQNSRGQKLPTTAETRACRSTFLQLDRLLELSGENTFNTCKKMLHTFSRLTSRS